MYPNMVAFGQFNKRLAEVRIAKQIKILFSTWFVLIIVI